MSEHWIVRPGQLHLGDLRAGIVRMDDARVLLQVHVGQELPIRRVDLAVGDVAVVDGWTVKLLEIDPSGRGSTQVSIGPPGEQSIGRS